MKSRVVNISIALTTYQVAIKELEGIVENDDRLLQVDAAVLKVLKARDQLEQSIVSSSDPLVQMIEHRLPIFDEQLRRLRPKIASLVHEGP
ncbi:hypothetical protein [Herpetosiphon gulosus]|uniref:Uncharacterized protein n=1 Tax=Herpetosiphon gulosus TaxID=1973496 RepID=A0ABP9X766_9CHLR